jgi:protocatechuate 3,4-dioxygenase beta subunit
VSTAGLSAVTVTATATAGAPSTITIVSGDAQSAPAGSTLSVPLAVKVVDQFGNAVANANVSWSSDANGTFSSAGAVTDATGSVQATYTLGAAAGLQHVTVTVSTAAGAILKTFSETGT